MMKQLILTSVFLFVILIPGYSHKKYSEVKIGMCSDVHLPTMHDADFRINTFMDAMKIAKPDFIIELGDFAEARPEEEKYYKLWDTFAGDKYHVIGNHEMDGGHSEAQALAARHMTSPYYSFDKNGFHFIVLDGNDKKDPNAKGYKQFIAAPQLEWFKDELAKSPYPVVVFSHQGLVSYHSVDEDYGVENAGQVRKIIEDHNAVSPAKKVIACFNGHTHWDFVDQINGVWYIHINSMSYNWLGEKYAHIRYSPEVDKNFKWIKYTAPFKDPLFTTVEISTKGYIQIDGKKSEWVGPTPFELGYPELMKKYIRPEITKRTLKFSLK